MPWASSRPGRGRVEELRDVSAGAANDDRARESSEEDAAPDAEAALPHLEDALPLRRRHLVPRGDVVVEPRADDAEGDTPHRDARDEIPFAAHRLPAVAGQPDAREDRDEQREPVHVQLQRADVDDAGVRRGDEEEHGRTLSDLIRRSRAGRRASPARAGSRRRARACSRAGAARPPGAGRCRNATRARRPRRRVAGPLELGRAPVLDELLFGQRCVGFRSFHRSSSPFYSVQRTKWFSPHRGRSRFNGTQTLVTLLLPRAATAFSGLTGGRDQTFGLDLAAALAIARVRIRW